MKAKIPVRGLTKEEKKALDAEIKRELADYDLKHILEINSMVLWILHDKFGFGPKKMRQFFEEFDNEIEKLLKRYEMETEDRVWLCTYKLKEYGVDIEKWVDEMKG